MERDNTLKDSEVAPGTVKAAAAGLGLGLQDLGQPWLAAAGWRNVPPLAPASSETR